jgi:hypothetical protein
LRLLLDEMYSPEIARQLQAKGYDVQSIQAERPDLEALDDEKIVEEMSSEARGVVTNNVRDFMPIHTAWIAAGRTHYGLVFSSDRSMPRSRNSIGLWVRALEAFLAAHPDEDALRNSIHFLEPRSS